MLKRNLITNYLGQVWNVVMGLAFLPLYIHYIGIESYGLIGLFGVITASLSLLSLFCYSGESIMKKKWLKAGAGQ